jgi:hypothetical protein
VSRYARTEQEQAQDSRLENFVAAARSGTAKRTEWKPPRSKLGDFISREVRGVDPDAGQVEQSVYDEAFGRLTEAERVQADPEHPDALVPRMTELVKEVENERELDAYNAMSHRQRLEARGVDQETIRSVYGNPS